MTKARFSSKMLKDLADSYRRRIERSRDSEEIEFRSKKNLLRDVKQADIINAMTSAAISCGAENAAIISCNCYDREIRFTVVINHPELSKKDKDIVKIDNARRESCKKHKQMLQDLDDWVIQCIENQEITQFENVPNLERSPIDCV